MQTKLYNILGALLICCATLFSEPVSAFTVVIDAGHGGKDPGAIGTTFQEKNVNLRVALLVGKEIKEKYPDVKVVYTRSTDVYLTLQERAAIANRANGDLFISIHTNASESHNAYGTETFTLGLAKTNANFEVAKRENSVMLLENNKEVYQGFDPASPDSYIMFELMQSTYIDMSILMADYVQTEFTQNGRSDRGVRQAGFWVLHQVKMASILVELGFITNTTEEKFLGSTEGEEKLAGCIVEAFGKFKREYEKRSLKADNNSKQKTDSTSSSAKNAAKGNAKSQTDTKSQDNKKPESKQESKSEVKPTAAADSLAKDSTTVYYKIQCFATDKPIKESEPDYKRAKSFGTVSVYKEKNLYKYTVGELTSAREANALLKRVQSVFSGAFIVKFKNGEKIK